MASVLRSLSISLSQLAHTFHVYVSMVTSQSKSQLNKQTYSHLETSDEFSDRLTRVRRLISFLFLIDKALNLFARFDFLLTRIK